MRDRETIRWWRVGALLAPLALLPACRHPCARVELAGVVSPCPRPLPPAGVHLQEVPPLGGAASADGPHGGTWMAVDARTWLSTIGEPVPSWQPTPDASAAVATPPTSQRLEAAATRLAQLAQACRAGRLDAAAQDDLSNDLQAVRAALALLPAGRADAGAPAGRGSAPVTPLVLVAAPQEWP